MARTGGSPAWEPDMLGEGDLPHAQPGPRSFLFICDEWTPERGGISSFNRSFATACARRGHRVACLVEQATPEEHANAEEAGVLLIEAYVAPNGPTLLVPTSNVYNFQPDTVVGHDRITGADAHTYSLNYLRGVRLVHIVHTVPSHIEPYKDSGEASKRAEVREEQTRRISSGADVVAAVGPLIAAEARHLLEDGFGSREVVQLNPGLEIAPTHIGRRRTPPARPTVLMVGRTGDMKLKGVDIAAAAVGQVVLGSASRPTLQIRGAPREEADRLHDLVTAIGGFQPHKVQVLRYSTVPGQIQRDLLQASLCVMPSRVDGFGLVAWEAIAAGTPVLISENCGAAQLLRSLLGPKANALIVPMSGTEREVIDAWTRAILGVLVDPGPAFEYAEFIRAELAPLVEWGNAVDAMCDALERRRYFAN